MTESDPVEGALRHPQIVGLCGVALGVVGVALLVGAAGNPVMLIMAGYAFGAGSVALALEVMDDV